MPFKASALRPPNLLGWCKNRKLAARANSLYIDSVAAKAAALGQASNALFFFSAALLYLRCSHKVIPTCAANHVKQMR